MRLAKTFRTSLDVRWTDCDLLGHINNAKYIEFAQDGRIRFFEGSGITFDVDNSLVVRHLVTDFERPLFLTSGPIIVEISILKIGNSSFTIRHAIFDKQDQRAAVVDAVLVGFDTATNTSKPLSAQVRAVLGEYLNEA